MKTLQNQYTAIIEGKGNKDHFLKQARHLFPELLTVNTTFNDAITILKGKSILTEAVGGIATQNSNKPDWFKIFNTNIKEAVGVKDKKEYGDQNTFEKIDKDVAKDLESNFDNSNPKNIDNVYGQSFLIGYLAEMDDPKNAEKTVDELKQIVAKNMAKDINYYAKNGMFAVKGIGLETSTEPKAPKGKYKSSGYGDLKESYDYETQKDLKALAQDSNKLKDSNEVKKAAKFIGMNADDEDELDRLTKAYVKKHEITDSEAITHIIDQAYTIFKSRFPEMNEGIGMFHDPIGFKKPELSDIDKIFTKEYKGGGMYDIFKNGKKVKSIEGEGNANAWINAETRKLRELETRSVDPMIKSKEFKVGDKVKYKGMNHEITRIVDDRIYIKNLKYGGRPDTWVKASDLKENKPGIQNTYNQEIDWIKYEVDYVPDDEEVYKKWPEPYRSRALKALEYRKKNFNTMSKEKLDSLKESKLRSLVHNLIKEELNEGIGMFHDPIGFKKPELSNIDKIFTKEYKGGGMYDIFKNGKKVKSIEGEGNANAWINAETRKLRESEINTNPYSLYKNHPKFKEAEQAIAKALKTATKWEDVEKISQRYREAGADDTDSREAIFAAFNKKLNESKLRSLVRNLIKEELNEGSLKLSDLKQWDNMYFIGDLDPYRDGDGWVSEDEAIAFIKEWNLEKAKAEAQRISQEEGVVQHVEETSEGSGEYRISDWYDSDLTVASYQNGMEL